MMDGYYPHVFCHVEGEEQTLTVKTDAGNEQSRFNDAEVQQVVRHVNPKSHHNFLLLQNISRKARDPISNGLKGKYIFLFFKSEAQLYIVTYKNCTSHLVDIEICPQ